MRQERERDSIALIDSVEVVRRDSIEAAKNMQVDGNYASGGIYKKDGKTYTNPNTSGIKLYYIIAGSYKTEEEALTRINAQQKRRGIGMPDETAAFTRDIENGVITAVITNDGTLADLQTVLDEHLKKPSSFK